MANELEIIEQQLRPLAPRFEEALANRMPVDRLIRTVMISIERTPKLLKCTRQSILNAAMTAAVLGLEVDGVTGQAFLIPYGDTAQLVIGYKGLNSLAARSGYTVTAGVVREGDAFDFKLGTGAFVDHKPKLGNKERIIGAWAVADAVGFSPIVGVLSIDEIMAVKAKSPGARKSDSPWNDPSIGFAAMAEKTVRRRLSRSMPLNTRTQDFLLAARMDEAFEEQGQPSHVTPTRDLIIDGAESSIAVRQLNETPSADELMTPRVVKDDGLDALRAEGMVAAKEGMEGLRIWFLDLPRPLQRQIENYKDSTLKPVAAKVDADLKAGAAA